MRRTLLSLSDKDKEDLLKCVKEMQSALFRGSNPRETFDKLKNTYSDRIIMMAMDLLEKSRSQTDSPHNSISTCINRCMSKVDKDKMDKAGDGTLTVPVFYEICEEAYKIFMNDEVGRALPIVFIFVQGNKTLGVIPIEVGENNHSPMDYLKEIVYQEQPDAYCFCGEGSMNKNIEESQHRYGDIINDPTSKDIVIMQGNSKKGDMSFHKMYDIIEMADGQVELKDMGIVAQNMESDKLP